MECHYPGHMTKNDRSKRLNPFRYTKRGDNWFVEMGFGDNSESFIFSLRDLPKILNLEKSLISESSELMDDGTRLSKYELVDAFVPTWTWKPGGIYCKSLTGVNKTLSKVRLARYLLDVNDESTNVRFLNKNKLDYRRENLSLYTVAPRHKNTDALPKRPSVVEKASKADWIKWALPMNPQEPLLVLPLTSYEILKEYPGVANPNINPYQLVNYENQVFYRMKALNGQEFFFSIEDLPNVLLVNGIENPTWFKMTISEKAKEAYIAARCGPEIVYLHRHLYAKHNTPVAGASIDHINWNKWDNRLSNLREADQKLQNENQGKRQRKHNAQRMPLNVVLPKYVTYNTEKLPSGGVREFYRVERHPKQTKVWSSSKSKKMSLDQKLTQAKAYLELLDTTGEPEKAKIRKVRGDATPLPEGFTEEKRLKYFSWTHCGPKRKDGSFEHCWQVQKGHPVLKKAGINRVSSVSRSGLTPTEKLFDAFEKLGNIDPDYEIPKVWEQEFETRKRLSGIEIEPKRRKLN